MGRKAGTRAGTLRREGGSGKTPPLNSSSSGMGKEKNRRSPSAAWTGVK